MQRMVEFAEYMENRGNPVHLGFGSLLGAVRNGGRIEGDNDIDICYLSRHNDVLNVFGEAVELRDEWNKKGVLGAYWNQWGAKMSAEEDGYGVMGQFHVNWEGFWLDVFTAWVDKNNRYYTCQYGEICEFEGFIRHGYEGKMFNINRNYDDVLSKLYGFNWETPKEEKASKRNKRDGYLFKLVRKQYGDSVFSSFLQ